MYNSIPVLAAIDNGYWDTKVYTGSNFFKFRSKYEKANDTLSKNNTDSFVYTDIDYLIGEGASMDNLELDKCNNELHRICTYAALARLSNYIGTEFNIVTGYPLAIYSANKEAFTDYLKTDGFIETTLNGELKVFKVSSAIVFPQGAGALYVNPQMYKNRVIAILDIGGLTVNGAIFDNLNLVRKSIFTENLGSRILQNSIKKALENRYGMNIQDYEMPGIIKNGLRKYKEESIKIKDEVIYNHLEEIKKAMRVNSWNVDNLDILLVGGGSLLLEEQLKRIFPLSVMSDDPVYGNVKGFYNIGRMVLEG